MNLSLDCILYFIQYLNFNDRIVLLKVNKFFNENVEIHIVPWNTKKITNDILLQKYYRNVHTLKLSFNKNITDECIMHLNLHTLGLSFNTLITNNGINNLTNLHALDISYNDNITNDGLKNLTNLKHLDIRNNTNITNGGIKHLDLITLDTSYYDYNITTNSVKHMKNCILKFWKYIEEKDHDYEAGTSYWTSIRENI
jgi:hypothetical protein